MTDLERALTVLGDDVAFPPTPDLATTVGDRVPARLPRRTPRRRWLVAAAAVAAGVVVLLALPGPRSAIADLLGIGAVRVTIVDELPADVLLRDPTGVQVTVAEADEEIDFDLFVLDEPPDAVYLDDSVPGGMVTLVYANDPAVFITQVAGTTDEGFLNKLVAGGTTITLVDVAGDPGFWIEGEPHVIFVVDRNGRVLEDAARLAGNTLALERDGLTIRIEGAASLAEALQVAMALR